MTREQVIEQIEATQIISILRGDMLGRERDIAGALLEAGICAIEVSIVSPRYEEAIASLAEKYGDRMAVGAGTVMTVEDLHRVASCGATFIVAPNTDAIVIEEARRMGLAVFPGAYTPTEIVAAHRAGADAVKVFPAVSLGPQYIKALQGPLPQIRLVPTGGINASNIGSYLDAGAFALGVGSELVGRAELEAALMDGLLHKAKTFVQARRRDASK